MIKSITTFFDSFLQTENKVEDDQDHEQHNVQLASAALMMEITRADQDRLEVEREKIFSLLRSLFDFGEEELSALVDLAESASDEAHDLFTFTKLINQSYNHQDKIQLVKNLWQVAYADGRIDAFEEHIIRRISGLLYLPNEDFIRAKILARDGVD